MIILLVAYLIIAMAFFYVTHSETDTWKQVLAGVALALLWPFSYIVSTLLDVFNSHE